MRVANIRYELADGVKADKDQQDSFKFASASVDDANRVAKAFGVTGTVQADEYGWTIGSSGEGVSDESAKSSSASLYMGRNGSFSMNGSYPVSSGVACAEPEARDGAANTEPCATTTTTINPNLPSESEAKQIASDALKSAGIDVGGAKTRVESFDQVVSVYFQPAFDGGVVDGVEHAVTVGPDDVIAYASGFVGDAKSVGSYELATLQRAVDRLNEMSDYPAMQEGDERSLAADATEPAIAPEDPGAPQNSEPTVVKLTAVKVGLMMSTDDSDQSLWLTPAYIFTTDQDGGGTVIARAAADKYFPPPTSAPPSDRDKPDDTDVPPAVDGGSSGGGSTGSGGSVEPAPPSRNCVTTDAPIAAEVCALGSFKVGEETDFTITASDPDRAFTEGPCGDGVTAEYGDDGEGDVRCLACSTAVADGPGKVSRFRSHTYAKPGAYTAKFTIKSGSECGEPHPNDSTVTLALKVVVA